MVKYSYSLICLGLSEIPIGYIFYGLYVSNRRKVIFSKMLSYRQIKLLISSQNANEVGLNLY